MAMIDLGAIPLKPMIATVMLVSIMALEHVWPRRSSGNIGRRWVRNLSMGALGAALVAIAIPLSSAAVAAMASDHGVGLLSHVRWPAIVEFACAIVALDMAIYWQHRWSHIVPILWRFHRVHHADTAFDVTLGVRFHPVEIVFSLLYKWIVIVLIGASASAVYAYEILLSTFALLTHANLAIPLPLDAVLRTLFVTPDWHRTHHSTHRRETDSHYGNILTLWDRLFRSHIGSPQEGHVGMRIGLDAFRAERDQTFLKQLVIPFAKANSHTH